MTDEPDFTIEYAEELCTAEQLVQCKELEKFGWRMTHLWERTPGEIIPWLLARRPQTQLKKAGWVHSYVTTDGKVHRYQATLRNLL